MSMSFIDADHRRPAEAVVGNALAGAEHKIALAPFNQPALSALRLWRTRRHTSGMSGFVLPGVDDLLGELEALPSGAVVTQEGYFLDGRALVVFRDRVSHRLLGFVMSAQPGPGAP